MVNKGNVAEIKTRNENHPIHVSCSGLIGSLNHDGSEKAEKARKAFKHMPKYTI